VGNLARLSLEPLAMKAKQPLQGGKNLFTAALWYNTFHKEDAGCYRVQAFDNLPDAKGIMHTYYGSRLLWYKKNLAPAINCLQNVQSG
jgi:hypothetical protein